MPWPHALPGLAGLSGTLSFSRLREDRWQGTVRSEHPLALFCAFVHVTIHTRTALSPAGMQFNTKDHTVTLGAFRARARPGRILQNVKSPVVESSQTVQCSNPPRHSQWLNPPKPCNVRQRRVPGRLEDSFVGLRAGGFVCGAPGS